MSERLTAAMLADRDEWTVDDLLDTFAELTDDVRYCLQEDGVVPRRLTADLRAVRAELRRRAVVSARNWGAS
jgi:hypothetical protein